MVAHLAQLEQMNSLPVINAVMTQAGLNIPMDRWDVRTTGSAHIVVNMGGQLSVRVAKTQLTGYLVAAHRDSTPPTAKSALRRAPAHHACHYSRWFYRCGAYLD